MDRWLADAIGELTTDTDSLKDSLEDKNRDGRVDSGETNPNFADTDGDGLSDSVEDANGNGIQDKLADGTLQETDPLAKDSDVDGITDGQEALGTWLYANGSTPCPGSDKSACVLLPKDPDSDGDGLRDGQETAGWRVGIWYERTMEKKTDYAVASDPRYGHGDTDGDGLTDFSEFLNVSDPGKGDTDGDSISDYNESLLKSNLTGIEGSPPQVTGIQLTVGVTLSQIVPYLWVPTGTTITVDFEISDNVGIDVVTVRLTHATGVLNHTAQIAKGALSGHIKEVFSLGIAQSILTVGLTGADVNVSASDINGNGAWGEFHVDSIAQAVVKAIVAYFTAIATVVVEAASAMINFIMNLIEGLIDTAVRPIVSALGDIGRSLLEPFEAEFPQGFFSRAGPFEDAIKNALNFGALFLITMGIMLALAAIVVVTDIWGEFLMPIIQPLAELITKGVTGLLAGVSILAAGSGLAALLLGFLNPTGSLTDVFLTNAFGTFQANTPANIWTSTGVTASIAAIFITMGSAYLVSAGPLIAGGFLDVLSVFLSLLSIILAVVSTTVPVQTNKELAVNLALASLWISLIAFMLSIVAVATITMSAGSWRLTLAGERILMIASVTLGLFGVFYDYVTFRAIHGAVDDWTNYWSCNRDPATCT